MRLRLASIVVAGLLVAAAPAAAQSRGCAHADTPARAVPKQVMKTAVVCLINQQRTGRGLPPLQEDVRLDRSAQGWTALMVIRGILTHGIDFASRITAAGLNWVSAGENIATGFGTPRQVVRAWMGSKDHCQNILSPNYLDVGTGVVRAGVRNWGGSSTWTQDFALPWGDSPPSGNYGPANGCPYQ